MKFAFKRAGRIGAAAMLLLAGCTSKPPALEVGQTRVDLGVVDQGGVARGSLAIANRGGGELRLEAVRECGCLRVHAPPSVAPSEEARIAVELDTAAPGQRELQGEVAETLTLKSNDPRRPAVPVTIAAEVRSRVFLAPARTLRAERKDDGSVTATATLVAVDGRRLPSPRPVSPPPGASLNTQPWSGRLRLPGRGPKPVPVSGYRVVLHIPPTVAALRKLVTMGLDTGHPEEPRIQVVVLMSDE